MFERQVDINSVIGQYHQILTALIEKDSASLPTMIEGVSVLSKVLDVKEDVGELKTIIGWYFIFSKIITCFQLIFKKNDGKPKRGEYI